MTSKIVHMKGDLLKLATEGHFDIVVQGCNCFNAMGGGIAKQIAKEFPGAVKADNETVKGDYNKLGNYTVMLGKQFNIINAYTQYHMSTGNDEFEYAAFDLVLAKIARAYPGYRFGFPYIGMGLARGNKDNIMNAIEHFAWTVAETNGTVTLVEFEQ